MLEAKNPLPGDDRIKFDAASHTYTVDGEVVPISVTGLIKQAVPEEHRFDATNVINKNLRSWRRNASSKYHSIVQGKTDEEAAEAIRAEWAATSTEGTAVHEMLERVVNGEHISPGNPYQKELFQYDEFCASNPYLQPFRSELAVFGLDCNGKPAVAGQIDLLAKTEAGEVEIIDYKRTAKDLSPNSSSYGKTWLGGVPFNNHYSYSLQCHIYAALLESQTGMAVSRCNILQIHPDLDRAILTECSDMRLSARVLLRSAGVVGF